MKLAHLQCNVHIIFILTAVETEIDETDSVSAQPSELGMCMYIIIVYLQF